jgi:hypothetical protein
MHFDGAFVTARCFFSFQAAQGWKCPQITAQSEAWQETEPPMPLAQKVHSTGLKTIFQPPIQHTGDFDGKDRRRRHENGQGKRSQVR